MDLAVSSANEALAKLNSNTHAVVNNHLSPTADFTHNPDAVFPTNDMQQTITTEVGAEHIYFINSTTLATKLLGDAIYANFFMLGFAYQKGLIPLKAESIKHAIELNGVSIEANQSAFLWGRRYVIDAEAVRRAAMPDIDQPLSANSETCAWVIAFRSSFLVAYQDQAYAERYRQLVERMRRAEQQHFPDKPENELPLTEAVARNYFKLLAYKDEYEIARLYSNGDFERSLAKQFEGKYKLRFHLAPPILAKRDPHSGHLLKREFGAWVLPLFRILARFKRLRGSKLDVFAHTAERKMERALIETDEQDIKRLIDELSAANHDTALEIASLPHEIRGFGHVKQANIERVTGKKAMLFEKLAS